MRWYRRGRTGGDDGGLMVAMAMVEVMVRVVMMGGCRWSEEKVKIIIISGLVELSWNRDSPQFNTNSRQPKQHPDRLQTVQPAR